jgi:RNA polymerase sigma factor (sigma-70 family)
MRMIIGRSLTPPNFSKPRRAFADWRIVRRGDDNSRRKMQNVRGDSSDALHTLARVDPRKVRIVEMRFFGGLTVEETAEVLRISPVTVRRDWSAAKIWLYRELTGGSVAPLEPSAE